MACHLLKQAINPELNFGDCLANWPRIAEGLAERSRKRTVQIRKLLTA